MVLLLPYAFISMISVYVLVFGVVCVVQVEKGVSAGFYFMVLESVMGLAYYVMVICFAEAVVDHLKTLSCYFFKEFFCRTGAVDAYYTRAKKDIEDEARQRDVFVKLHLEVGTKLLELLKTVMDERVVTKEAGSEEAGVKTPLSPPCDADSMLSAAHTE
jgi:hypothetical protein